MKLKELNRIQKINNEIERLRCEKMKLIKDNIWEFKKMFPNMSLRQWREVFKISHEAVRLAQNDSASKNFTTSKRKKI